MSEYTGLADDPWNTTRRTGRWPHRAPAGIAALITRDGHHPRHRLRRRRGLRVRIHHRLPDHERAPRRRAHHRPQAVARPSKASKARSGSSPAPTAENLRTLGIYVYPSADALVLGSPGKTSPTAALTRKGHADQHDRGRNDRTLIPQGVGALVIRVPPRQGPVATSTTR
jgi:hypothetical protein